MQCSVTTFPAPSTLLTPDRKWKWNGFYVFFFCFVFCFSNFVYCDKNDIKPYLPMRSIFKCQFSCSQWNFHYYSPKLVFVFSHFSALTIMHILLVAFSLIPLGNSTVGRGMEVVPRVSNFYIVILNKAQTCTAVSQILLPFDCWKKEVSFYI